MNINTNRGPKTARMEEAPRPREPFLRDYRDGLRDLVARVRRDRLALPATDRAV